MYLQNLKVHLILHKLVKATMAALSELRDAYTVAQNSGVLEKVFKGLMKGWYMETIIQTSKKR